MHPGDRPTAADRGFAVRALGEIAVRTSNMAAMLAFYRDVIGLEVLAGGADDPIVFFRIGAGYGGHTSVLALFRGDTPGAVSSLHHLALSLGAEEQAAVMAWYDRIGQAFRVEDFPWIGWRGIFTQDPDGNTVELVAFVGKAGATG